MNKRRVLQLSVCAVFLLSALPLEFVSAMNLGKSCTRAGAISGTKKNPLICRRVQGKLVWRRDLARTTTTSPAPAVAPIGLAPVAPSKLMFSVKTPFDDTGRISWTDNSLNEEYFYVSNVDPAKSDSTPLSSLFFRAAANATSVGVWKFESGVTYCYWVMSSNSFGNSPWVGPVCSNPSERTTTTVYVPPTTVYVPPTTVYVPPTTTYVPPVGGGGGGGGSSANWLGCYFKGTKMWGSVYISSSSWAADFVVYQSSSSWSSDLKVYTTTSSWAATSCGIWYITSSSWAADFTIYLTSSSWNADFSIYSTGSSWSAGR